jgi:hypothetical protein
MADTDMPGTNTPGNFSGPPVIPTATIRAVVKIASGTPDPARTVVSSVNPTNSTGG